ncbi:glycosyl transferase family 1 [Devosia riboflavina]|uniref:Glycosyl transferase family 1 n=1 Tax=Devosia riboflavina TaxID=46914 RepID=A0A087LZA1_9HYPH|nr:glycosyltransferase [Devosia riboflavina]KFL29954.1 glycosyl transferase family 1 [Devosia riboflavina]
MSQKYLVFVSAARQLCGVEAFSRLLAQHFGSRATAHVLDADLLGLLRALRGRDAVAFNFPIVGWKRRLFTPGLAALVARLMGKDVVVFLHEWLALDWKRRIVLAPVVLCATRLKFSAPEIAAEFAATRFSRFVTGRRQVVPIPPNILPSEKKVESERSRALSAQRRAGRLILGQFGSIYPKKQSAVVLQVAAELLRAGHDVGVVFAGSFIRGMDNVEENFFASVQELGLADRVTVTGYIADDDVLARIFAEVDVFCYLFAEGLTSRRGSVLAAALSGRRVVVNAPLAADALDHHLLFQRLIETSTIRLVPTDADIPTVAAAVLAAGSEPVEPFDVAREVQALWTSIGTRIDQ